LYYRIQLTGSGTDAFDLTFTDTLPTVLNSPSIASVSGANLADFEIVGGVLRTTVAADIDLAPGASIILYVLGTVDYSVIPGQAIANTGTVRWTSLNGAVSDRSTYNTDSDERNGSGIPAVNDYTSFATVNVSISTTSHFKYLMNTSELHTSGLQAGRTRVSVGEIVRYRLVVQIPEGTSPNFQLQDQLPPGLTYLDDGSATIAFVSTDPVGNPIQSTGIGIIPAIPSGCNLSGNAADAATPAQTSLCILDDLNSGSDNATNADPDVYTTTGVDVYFKLGTLRNNDSDADGEFVVIEFNALVDNNNTSGANRNDASDTRDNNFLVFINGAQVGVASGNVGVYIAEPLLTVVKSTFTTPGDAGDTVEYRLTVTAGAGVNRSTAFDLSLTDTLNANLVPVSASVFSTTQPATCTGNGSGTTGFLTSAGFSGQLATITATCLDPGRNIVFSIVARVANNAPAGQIIPNTGTLRYTSLPGSGTALTINTIPAVTSVTPGASGTTYGERDGSNGTGNPNDHYSTSTVNLTLLTPTFDKRPASPLNYTIGDTVTFNILVTLNEGVTRSLSVLDNLPAGLQYVTGSVEVITTAALSGGLLTNDFDGTFTNSAPGWFTCTGVCGSGDDVILNFGDTTVAADLPVDDPSDDAFLVRFQARVLDVPANIDGLVLTNRANITYINPNTGSPVTLPDDIATVTLIEARIATDKDVTPTTSVQAGDALTYTVRFTNTGNSPAYDVTAMDSLAQGVDFIALTGCVDQASASVPSLAVDNGATVDFGGNPAGSRDIPVSGWIECTYSAVALNGLYMNGSHVNTVDADWTSLNGSVSGERDYNDTGSSPFDALQDQDTATFTADAPTFVKDDSGITQVVIGDTITFHLTVGGEAGTYRDVLITDVLPAGLIYNVGSSQVTLNGSSAVRAPDSVSAPNDGSAAVTLTWDFNDLYKDGTDMVITYTAQVANVIGNQINGTLINNAAFDHDHADGTPATQLTSSASSTITEPVIVTTKNALPTSGVEAGDVINYTTRFTNTGTSTAYETTAQDALPANVDYNSDAACVFFDGVTTNLIAVTVTGSTSLNFGTWDIPATAPDSYVECTYSITTRSDIALGASHTNLVDADWTSLNGTDANERNYNDSVSRTGVDETPGADDDVAAFTTDAPASLTKGIDVTQTAIGDVFHITITIVSPLGAITDTSLDDVLPAGMIYVTGTQTVTSNITTPAFSVTGPNDGTAATTLIWDFGDAVVTGNPVVVEYDARAANVAGNVDGTGLTNNVTFHYTDGAGPHTFTDDATVSVIEPLLTVTKAHSVLAIAPDAGDTVHYIVDIAPDLTAPNVSTATAYDVVFSDLLPSTYVSLDVSSISVTATGWTPTSVDTSASSVTTVDVRVSDIPNTPGTGLRIEYDVTLKNTVTPSQLIANTGDLTWTSTPGSNGNERTGSGSGANDYSDSSTDSFTVHDPAFSKSIASTDNPHTIDPSVAIGETITFDLVITLPEGTTPSIHIYDDLPAGLQYIVETPTVIPAPGFIGSIPTPTVAPATPPAGNGQDVTVDFTAITVDPDGDPANDHLTVRFRAVVLNDLANQDGGSLLNTATMTVAGTDYSDDATASIVEPVLTIAKSVTDPYPGPGQTLDFTIVVEHDALLPSTASAHNVVIFDDLPDAQLTLVPGSISVATLGGVSGVVFNPVVEPVQVQVDRIDVGGRVTVTFQAMVSSGITVGEAVANTATARWTSMPGPVADERLGTGGALNDYAAVNTVNLSADKSITKTLIADNHLDTVLPEVAIGELLTYRVEFNVPTGSTDAVTLTDQLEPGLAYVDCLSIAADAGIATSLPGGFDAVCQNAAVTAIGAPANPASPGRQVVFDFGTLTNISGGIGTVTVEYRAAVLDVIENQDAQTLNNRATLTWSYGSLNSQPPVPVSVVEPELLLEKTASVGTALPGADIVFTLTVRHDTANSTADAYDVLLRDDLPSGLTLIGIPVPMSGIAPTSITVTGTLIEVFWADFPRLPDGESVIQFTARLGSLLPGTSVSNEATVEWTSLPGTPPNPYAPPQPVLPSGVQSVYNARSTERRYDPLSPVDIYQTTATSAVGVPRLPDTGFAPGILTGLPEQPQDMSYAQLDGMWLEIPALGVRMPIIGVPMSEAGWDLTWLGDQAGYLEGTAYPSWDGNTGITGHVYLPNGSPGPFVDLGRLYWGQQVIVHLDGFEYVYEVRSVRRVMPGDLSVLGHSDTPVLTLITCQGYDPYGNAYRYRVAVRAVLVAIH
jgi:LPXTG-site transpeptidase (sortase) family protein